MSGAQEGGTWVRNEDVDRESVGTGSASGSGLVARALPQQKRESVSPIICNGRKMATPARAEQDARYLAMVGLGKPKAKRASRKKPDPEPEREPIDITEPLGKVEAQLLFLNRVTKDFGDTPLPRYVPEPPPGLEPQELDSEPLQTEGPQRDG